MNKLVGGLCSWIIHVDLVRDEVYQRLLGSNLEDEEILLIVRADVDLNCLLVII